jgi:SEC-C motif-containing protein
MRSRYTAYVLGEIDWIMETHDPRTLDQTREEVEAWSKRADWQGLRVLAVDAGGKDDPEGYVSFEARFNDAGAQIHAERSRFVKKAGRWLYIDGVALGTASTAGRASKVGRNEPCPCGSGKKHKRCCG